jgi:hypothetical protein
MFLHEWRLTVQGQEPRLALLTHLPLGEARPSKLVRSRRTGELRRVSDIGRKLQAMGTLAGFPDYLLPVSSKGEHGLFLEMKRAGLTPAQCRAACSPAQRDMQSRLRGEGYAVLVCSGWVDAARALCHYLACLHLAPSS